MPNWLRGSSGIVTPPAPEILNFIFARLVKYKIKGVYLYGAEAWGQAAVNNYVLAKLMWNPNQDAAALAREWHARAYGADAAPKMQRIYILVDASVKAHYIKDASASYTVTPAYMKDVLAANYPQIETLYLEAQRAAANGTTGQRARLQLFGDNLALTQWQLRAFGFLPEKKDSPLFRSDAQIEAMISGDIAGFGIAPAPDLAQSEKKFAPLRAALAPPITNARAATPFKLRGATRILFSPTADDEIQITPKTLTARGEIVRYDVHDSLGKKVVGGVLRPNETIRFPSSQNQLYYFDIDTKSAFFDLEIHGAPHAIAADTGALGLHFSGTTTPLYFQVPAGTREFTITIQTDSPGETSLSELYSPDGKLVQNLDTQTAPVARFSIEPTPDQAGF